MSAGNELDINTLSWVKSEIDETLEQARSALEAYVDDQADESRLQFCLNYIHQVRGTLHMVELYGASMAAEEMEALVQALIDNQVSNRDDAFEVLVRGIMQLPDYLEHLLVGHQDLPMVLLPLLNDLRASRGEALLSENALFSPNLEVDVPNGSDLTTDISELARRLRHNYHLGLLGWFRDKDSVASLKRISDVISQLREVSGEAEVTRLLWVANGLVESLRAGGLESSISIKLLLGQLDRQIKRIIDNGMIALQSAPPHELLKNLLYYVATSQSTDDCTVEVKKAFQLDQALPDTRTLEKARADLSAPNAALMGTVSSVLMEDLVRVKDSLDVFVRKEERNPTELVTLGESLGQMADTLGMMGLGVQRNLVVEQVELLRQMVSGDLDINDQTLIGVASALLSLESSLKESTLARAANENLDGEDSGVTAKEKLQEAERHELLKTVIEQANTELLTVKDALNDMSRYPGSVSVLSKLPDSLEIIRGSLAMLDLDRVAQLLESCANYVRNDILEPQQTPDADSLEHLADAISSIEYYLESLAGKWAHPESILLVAEKSLEKLEELSASNVASETEVDQNDSTQPDLVIPDELLEDESSADTVIEIKQPSEVAGEGVVMSESDFEEDTQNEISLSDIDLSSVELSQPDLSEIPGNEEVTLNDISIVGIESSSDSSDSDDEEDTQTNLSLSELDLSSLDLDEAPSEGTEQTDIEDFDLSIDGADTAEELDASQTQAITLNDIDEGSVDLAANESVPDDIANDETLAMEVDWPGGVADASSASHDSLASNTYEIPEEIDDEILEIFMEEAEEQYQLIDELLAVWVADTSQEDALIDMRRSFHTLKGSGRLVGANDLGEFAWAFENVLNRIIDKTIVPTPILFQLLNRAKESLPQLFELFKIRQKPDAVIYNLMKCADDLREGKDIVLDGAEQPPESVQSPEPVSEPAEAVESSALITKPATDAFIIEEIDPVLLDIFVKEVATHLQSLRNFTHHWKPGLDESENEPVMRALHTLKGSSRTTGVTVIADVCSEFELFLKDLQQVHYSISAPAIPVLNEMIVYIESIIPELNKPGSVLDSNQDLILKIRELRSTIPVTEPSVASTSSLIEAQIEAHINETLGSSIESPSSLTEITATDIEMREYDDELLDIFIEEGEEILEESDNTLNSWMETPEDNALLEAMQRQLHTLKGGARMAGVVELGDLGHVTESLLTAIVDGQQSISKKTFTVLQQVQDELVRLLDNVKQRKGVQYPKALIQEVEQLLGKKSTDVEEDISLTDNNVEETILEPSFDSVVDENDEINNEEVNDIQPEVGDLQFKLNDTEADLSGSDNSDTLILELPDTFEQEDQSGGSETALLPEEEKNEPKTQFVPESNSISPEPNPVEISERLEIDEATSLKSDDVSTADNVVEMPQRKDNVPASLETESTEATVEDKLPQTGDKSVPSSPQQGTQIRVRADLLNELVNFAGEVSIYRSRMEQQSNSFRYNLRELDDTVSRLRQQLRQFEIETETQIEFRKEETLNKNLDDFDPLEFDRFTYMQQLSRGMLESLNDLDSLRDILSNITRESETLLIQQARVNTELQEGLMRTRMVPFSGQTTRLRRIVRQTSNELNKDIALHLHGMDGEIDRQVLDRIMPAVEHMLRNSIAHGIESEEVRLKNNKTATARIDLTFGREGSDIILKIEDDGAGFNLNAIRNKAIERGLIKASDNVPRETLLNLVMESGFSTADTITQISGRGVGMDVVNNEIKQLGGLIKIDTEEGKGTAITINLPLTLAIARALMINVGDDIYATPLLGVQAVERITKAELEAIMAEEKPVYHWLDEAFPVLSLSTMLGLPKVNRQDDNTKVPLLLVRSGEYHAAIEVDGLIGSREVVVKPVGPQLSTLRGISGATIMGDGQVVLILDLGVLLRLQDTLLTVTEAAPLREEKTKHIPLVMVVDDSITVRKVTTRLLERHNYKVVTAKDGVDALTQLQEIHPDVILLDVEMPRMDGYELATNVRNDIQIDDIPIIMITSRTADKHKQRAFDIGVNEYMGKPYNEADLLTNIEKLVEN